MKRTAAVRLNFAGDTCLGPDMDEEGNRAAREAAQVARVALIVAMMALAIAILGLFLPIH